MAFDYLSMLEVKLIYVSKGAKSIYSYIIDAINLVI